MKKLFLPLTALFAAGAALFLLRRRFSREAS